MQTDNSPHNLHSPMADSLFASRVKQIQKTNQMLNNLEQKLTGFFNDRKQQLQSNPSNTRRHHDFKVFNTKSLPKPQLQQLMNRKTELSANKQPTERQCKSEQVQQLDRMEKYYKRKNGLIENKILQLQRDLEGEERDRMEAWRENQRLEGELAGVVARGGDQEGEGAQGEEEGAGSSLEIIQLEGILKQQKEKNARVRKELEVLKQNYKTLKKTKTEYMQGEIRRKSTDQQAKQEIQQLRVYLQKQKDNYKHLKEKFSKNEQIQILSKQLQKLKQLVSAKSKLRLK